MKRIGVFLLTALCLCLLLGIAGAETYGDYTYTVNDDGTIDAVYTGNAASITVPAMIDGKTVAGFSCSENGNLTSVTLSEGITSLSWWAFYNCTSLSSVTLPESLQTIEGGAFENCESLLSLTIPEGVTSVHGGAFSNCPARVYAALDTDAAKAMGKSGLKFYLAENDNVILQYGVDDEDQVTDLYVWASDTDITEAAIPIGVTAIAVNGFSSCEGLTEITIPEGVTSVGWGAFYNCTGLSSVTLPDTLETIDGNAFENCASLEAITLPDGVASVYGAFYNCPAMVYAGLGSSAAKAISRAEYHFYATGNSTVSLQYTFGENDSVTGLYAWAHDTDITAATIPAGVTAIADNGFNSCESLTEITIPAGVTAIGEGAFYNCTSLSSVTLPDTLETIDRNAFENCASLEALTVPSGVTEVGNGAFSSCTAMLYAGQTSSAAKALSRAGYCFYLAGNDNVNLQYQYDDQGKVSGLYAWAHDTDITEAAIPAGVTRIPENAFNSCESLTAVVIGEGVTDIEGWAFYNCTSLSSVTLPESLRYIHCWAFENCVSLEALSIPNGVTDIDGGSFYGCPVRLYAALNSNGAKAVSKGEYCFYLSGNVNVKLQYTFDGYGKTNGLLARAHDTAITEATIPAVVTAIPSEAFRDCESLEAIEIPEGVTAIEYLAFCGCTSLSSVTLPDTLESIAWDVFDNCASLLSLTIPNGVTNVDGGSFDDCPVRLRAALNSEAAKALSRSEYFFYLNGNNSVKLRYGFDSYGKVNDLYAWADSTAVTSVTIPAGVTVIPGDGFRECENLTSVTIPEGVTKIDYCAFYSCTSLSSVTLPSTLQTIEWNAFDNCASLLSLTIPNGVTGVNGSAFNDCPVRLYAALGSEAAKAISSANLHFYVAGNPNVKLQYSFDDYGKTNGLLARAHNSAIASASIPAGVTAIPGDGFIECENLTSVTIPEGVTFIGSAAFYSCTSLSSVTLPSTLRAIDWSAFEACASLLSVTIPDGVTSVDGSAFYDCPARLYAALGTDGAKALSRSGYHFYLAGNVSVSLQYSFDGYGKVADLYAWADNTGVTSASIPAGVTAIPGDGFRECENLTSVTIPEGVTFIGSAAFYSCTSLSSVSLPSTLQTIDWNAFTNCASLLSVTIPSGTTSVDGSAFSDCPARLFAAMDSNGAKALSSAGYHFYLSGNLNVKLQYGFDGYGKVDGLYASAHSAAITSAVIPAGVTAIPDSAFARCESLTDVYIPDSVTDISTWEPFPMASETLHVGCISYALSWAVEQEYPLAGEAGTAYGYLPVHQEVIDAAVAPTCTATGLTEGKHCADCAAVLIPQETVAALGHSWKAVTYTWAADDSTVTASRVCARNASHKQTETAAVTATVTVPATCESMGKTKYTAVFTNTAFKQQTKTKTNIPALGHDWQAATYTWASDNSTVTASRLCARDESHVQTETVNCAVTVTLPATCESMGKTKYTAVFTNAAFAQQTKTVTDIPALGHSWQAVTYTWAADDSTVTASRVCARNASHKQTETAAVTATVTVPATCESMGKTKYTAAFTNTAFKQQTKTKTNIPALGHDWQAATYTWANDNSTVTASRVCARDGQHVETETAAVIWSILQSPTETEKGRREYVSAAFQHEAFAVQRKTLEDIPALNEMNTLYLPSLLTSIEKEAFFGAAAQAVIIPEGCTAIGSKAFANCTALIYVRIPASVTSIADDAFAGCGSVIIDRAP